MAAPNYSLTWPPMLTTTDYLASPNDVVLVDTTGAPITITLPAFPTFGQVVKFIDLAGTWDTNNLTVDGNGSNILGQSDTLVSDLARQNFALIFSGTAQGWTLLGV